MERITTAGITLLVGDVLSLREQDYVRGIGPVTIKVTNILALSLDREVVHVSGVQRRPGLEQWMPAGKTYAVKVGSLVRALRESEKLA